MPTLGRRNVLALAVGGGLAACVETEAEFLVTKTQRIHRRGDDRFDYPQDILYRVSIENTGPNREDGRLELTLVYDPENGERKTWSKSDTLSYGRGRAGREEYVFENVFDGSRDTDNYRLEAEIVQDGE